MASRLHHIAAFGDEHRQGSLTASAAEAPSRQAPVEFGEGDGHTVIFFRDVCGRCD